MNTLYSISVVFLTCLLTFTLPTKNSSGLDILHTTSFVRYHPDVRNRFILTSTSKILLYAAKNETISFQIILSDINKTARKISIGTRDLNGSETFDKENIDLFLLQNCQESYQPDCLIPFQPGESIPLKALRKDTDYQAIWFDLYIPSDQPSGLYRGNIEIKLNEENPIKTVVELRVYPFTLPEIPSLKADLNNYGVGFVKVWGYEVGSQKGYQVERAFYLLARKHKMTLNPLPYKSQRGNPHPTMAPKISGSGDNIHISDWSEYDKRYEPYFSGIAFEDGIPIDHQYLPFNPEWPSDFSNYLNNKIVYKKEWKIIGKEFMHHFEEKGWDQTIFHIFPNQKPRSNNQIPWNLDEPKGVKDYEALRYYADLTHKVFSKESKIKVRFRMDISHFYCDKHKGNKLKDFRVNGGNEILSSVDIWAISKHSMDNLRPQKEALQLKKQGKSIYEYVTSPLINDPLTKGIQYGWNAWLRREDGIIFWNTVKKMGRVSDGRDFLIYTGEKYGIKGPVASIRLKAIRRGIQDYEYIKLASASNNNIVYNVVKDCDLSNLSSYKNSLNKLANIIVSSMH